MTHPQPLASRRDICEAVHTRAMLSDRSTLQSSVNAVNARIAGAATAAGRAADSVRLIAVSKTRNATDIASANQCGVIDFGENYVQEAIPKILALSGLPLVWHFIGRLQTNKTRDVASHFHWVHTLDRETLARRLNDQTPSHRHLNVCIQLNVDDDAAKGGLSITQPRLIEDLVRFTGQLERLHLRGLMTILDVATPPLQGYLRLAAEFDRLRAIGGVHWDTLSMGMSGDFEAAIAAGATQVRIGQAIFGSRLPADGGTQ